jgi:hypothetical protein
MLDKVLIPLDGAAIVTGNESVLIIVLAMGVGMYAFEVLDVRFSMEPDGGTGLLPGRSVGKT